MSEEPKWAFLPGAKAASALVRGDTHRNHRSYQSNSVSLKAAGEERTRGPRGRGGEVKRDKEWLTFDSFTRKQMAKNTQKEEAKESSATEPVWDHDNDAKWLKQRYLFSQPICHIVFWSLGRKLPMRYLFKMLTSWRERGLLSRQEVERQLLFRSSASSSRTHATF